MKLSIQSFGGIAPRTNPRYLPDNGAQVALNVEAFGQSVKPLKGLSAAVLTLAKSGVIQSLYRFGQDLDSESQYWFHWLTDVDVCRSQIAGDAEEWTFYTGDGYPKATYSSIATAGTAQVYPTTSRRLGLPAPTNLLTATAATPDTHPAKVTVSAAQVAEVTDTFGVRVSYSVDAGVNWTTATAPIAATAAPYVTLTASQVAEVTSAYGVYVSLDNGATKALCPVTTANGTAPSMLIPNAASVPAATTLQVSVDNGKTYKIFTAGEPGSTTTEASLAARINFYAGSVVTATVEGTAVRVKALTTGKATRLLVAVGGTVYPTVAGTDPTVTAADLAASITNNAKANNVAIATATVIVSGGQASVKVTAARGGADVTLKVWWGATANQSLSATGGANAISVVVAAVDALPNITATDNQGAMVVATVPTGKDVRLSVRWGEADSQRLTASGSVSDLDTPETRVYTYTYINRESGLVTESAPWSPDNMATATVDVYPGRTVTLTNLPTTPPAGGWSVSGLRIYRATAGVFLYVTELALGVSSYTDSLAADALGEPCPSTLWTPPPEALAGMLNLPNGMMAGFVGRDVHFSEPYRPYAWPDTYTQTVDAPVVGLGRMDTTLAVLTKGAPYLMQGSSPEYMTVVKSDLEQACVSKRSIVSLGGAVLYASPDGLVALSPGGSQVLTTALFTREYWQRLKPETLHAYGHDNRYIAFHDPQVETLGAVQYTYHGFVLDLATKQFVRHGISGVKAGYSDPRNDQLYLVTTNRGVVKWDAGANLTGIWRSKVFALPQITGFTCAQVEAEAYDGLKAQLFRDGVKHVTDISASNADLLAPDTSKVPHRLTGRYPFRLEPQQGREWEVELTVTQEIFNVCVAQAMSEIASA